jgi:hypothetical protein
MSALIRVHDLLRLASSSPFEEEARTSAVMAARLIAQEGFVVTVTGLPSPSPTSTKTTSTKTARTATEIDSYVRGKVARFLVFLQASALRREFPACSSARLLANAIRAGEVAPDEALLVAEALDRALQVEEQAGRLVCDRGAYSLPRQTRKPRAPGHRSPSALAIAAIERTRADPSYIIDVGAIVDAEIAAGRWRGEERVFVLVGMRDWLSFTGEVRLIGPDLWAR